MEQLSAAGGARRLTMALTACALLVATSACGASSVGSSTRSAALAPMTSTAAVTSPSPQPATHNATPASTTPGATATASPAMIREFLSFATADQAGLPASRLRSNLRVSYVETTLARAEKVLFDDSAGPPGRGSRAPTAPVVVFEASGKFVGRTFSRPSGFPASTGTVLTMVVNAADGRTTDSGLSRTTADLDRLGTVHVVPTSR